MAGDVIFELDRIFDQAGPDMKIQDEALVRVW